MNHMKGAIILSGLVVILGWSSLIAWVCALLFSGSWIGYGLALAVNLVVAAGMGRYVARRSDHVMREWTEMP